MRKSIYLLLVAIVTGMLFSLSATPVKINISEAGSGKNLFKTHSSATEVIVTGKINQLDLLWLKEYCRSIVSLDISETSIESYNDEDNYIDYKADELTTALSYTSTLKHITLPKSLKSIVRGAFSKCTSLESITLPMPTIPKVGGNFVDYALMKSVKLYVPESLVTSYQSTQIRGLKFANILPIKEKEVGPYDKVVFDDLYGQCYYPIKEGQSEPDPIFYVFYMDNHTEETINKIEFAYWFDNDKQNVKYKTKNDLQLMPGQEMQDGEGFITFETPRDTQTHLITIKPHKINDIEVDLGERAKIFRRYYINGTYRRPTHYIELFVNPKDKEAYEKYKTIILSMAKLYQSTQQANRFEVVSYVSSPNSKFFSSSVPTASELAKLFRIDSIPRVMLNRNLMTPYGMLNNDFRLKDLSIYTPSLKIGRFTDVFDFLFQRSFYNPAFAKMAPSITKDESGKFIFKVTGEISKQSTKDDLYLNLYLVENTPLPSLDENDSYPDADAPVFQKLVKMLTPLEGLPLSVNDDYTYSFSTEALQIEGYESGKYKLVASIYNYDNLPYKMSILQSCGIVLEDKKESSSVIDAETVQSGGELSFAVASANEGTEVSIDWGDGNWVDYTIGKDYTELKSGLKGKVLHIKGDITKLNCIGNKLSKLDVTKAPQLEVLQAEFNYLSELDLTQSVNLLNVEFFSNTLKEIDITNCTKLIRFVGSGNFLNKIDISKCPNLEYFDCARMSKISSIDFSNCHKLKHVIVNECSLSSLNIPTDAPLEELLCAKNQIRELDLTHFNKLIEIDCSENKIERLHIVSPNLETLYAMQNNLKSLDISVAKNLKDIALLKNPELKKIDLSKNLNISTLSVSSCGLKELSVSHLKELNKLWTNSNELKSLDLSKNSKLYLLQAKNNQLSEVKFPSTPDSLAIVSLANNQLSSINFVKADSLRSLDLGSNKLTEISTAELPQLEIFNIRKNNIHKLDFSKNPKLNMLGVVENGMTACELNAIYKQLPTLNAPSAKINLYNGDKNDSEAKGSKTTIAEERNWKPAIKGDGSGCNTALLDIYNTATLVVWKSAGRVHLHSPYEKAVVSIYTTDGSLVKSYEIDSHETRLTDNLEGSFIIVCQDRASANFKVVKTIF